MLVNDGYWLYKIIKLNDNYPVYNEDDEKIGETEKVDLAIITLADSRDENGYYETVILTGKYFGYNNLALDKKDLKKVKIIKDHKMLKENIL